MELEKSNQWQELREQSLLKRWATANERRLTEAELSEIRHLPPVAAWLARIAVTSGLPDDVSVGVGQWKKYSKRLREYCDTFETSLRAIKSWVAIGKAANPPDLPPLDDPPQIKTWWERHMKQRVPLKLLSIALAAAKDNESEGDVGGINIRELNIDNLDSLKQAQRYLAAIDQKLARAYALGNDDEIRRWQAPFDKALEAVRKAQNADREERKLAGDLIPRAELFSELNQLLTMQRNMRATMDRRIVARLALPEEYHESLRAAIRAERDQEDSVFRQLRHFQGIEDAAATFELKSQAA